MENYIEQIYDIIDGLRRDTPKDDPSAQRNLAIAVTHLEDAALRVGPPLWYRPNPRTGER